MQSTGRRRKGYLWLRKTVFTLECLADPGEGALRVQALRRQGR